MAITVTRGPSGKSSLFALVRRGDASALSLAIQRGPHKNRQSWTDIKGWSQAMEAAHHGKGACLLVLIKARAALDV